MGNKKQVKPRVVKTRNHKTMTEAGFWSFIRSSLRQKSRFWKPVQEAKRLSRRIYKGDNKRQKFEYQCAKCNNWYPEKDVNVDHIEPVGILRNANDLPGFVERLFIESHGLQVLCSTCHDEKTKKEIEYFKTK